MRNQLLLQNSSYNLNNLNKALFSFQARAIDMQESINGWRNQHLSTWVIMFYLLVPLW